MAGSPHVDGCDVARCTACGWQRISCEHEDSDEGWGQVWTGEYPGSAECREHGLMLPDGWPDLNRLASLAHQGLVAWDGTRWQMTATSR